MTHRFLRGLLLALSLCPPAALAGSVFLNGVNIDGVTNQKFEKATVRIDEKGNVLIEATGYAVRQVDGGARGANPWRRKHRWLPPS